jgi:hypothetical protein
VGEGDGETMSELKDTEMAAGKFDDKLHKLIKRTKKQRGMLWPSGISKLEVGRADVKSMIKVYHSGPKDRQDDRSLRAARRARPAPVPAHQGPPEFREDRVDQPKAKGK